MARHFVFPITTGRSGTVYLTELLRQNWSGAEVHHERMSYSGLGLDSPDASHFTLFNSVGNAPRVRDFWAQKAERVLTQAPDRYGEISHVLFKAGLVENLAPFTEEGEVHLVLLTRDIAKIHWSYVNRFEFSNYGYTWLFALDPRYPNVLVKSAPFAEHGMAGHALWYIHEVFTRMEYYALLMADEPRVHIHRVDLSDITRPDGAARLLAALGQDVTPETVRIPARQNESRQVFFGDDMKRHCERLVAGAPLRAKEIAWRAIEDGRRLGDGPRRPVVRTHHPQH